VEIKLNKYLLFGFRPVAIRKKNKNANLRRKFLVASILIWSICSLDICLYRKIGERMLNVDRSTAFCFFTTFWVLFFFDMLTAFFVDVYGIAYYHNCCFGLKQ
jgi:hypothetical protein